MLLKNIVSTCSKYGLPALLGNIDLTFSNQAMFANHLKSRVSTSTGCHQCKCLAKIGLAVGYKSTKHSGKVSSLHVVYDCIPPK